MIIPTTLYLFDCALTVPFLLLECHHHSTVRQRQRRLKDLFNTVKANTVLNVISNVVHLISFFTTALQRIFVVCHNLTCNCYKSAWFSLYDTVSPILCWSAVKKLLTTYRPLYKDKATMNNSAECEVNNDASGVVPIGPWGAGRPPPQIFAKVEAIFLGLESISHMSLDYVIYPLHPWKVHPRWVIVQWVFIGFRTSEGPTDDNFYICCHLPYFTVSLTNINVV